MSQYNSYLLIKFFSNFTIQDLFNKNLDTLIKQYNKEYENDCIENIINNTNKTIYELMELNELDEVFVKCLNYYCSTFVYNIKSILYFICTNYSILGKYTNDGNTIIPSEKNNDNIDADTENAIKLLNDNTQQFDYTDLLSGKLTNGINVTLSVISINLLNKHFFSSSLPEFILSTKTNIYNKFCNLFIKPFIILSEYSTKYYNIDNTLFGIQEDTSMFNKSSSINLSGKETTSTYPINEKYEQSVYNPQNYIQSKIKLSISETLNCDQIIKLLKSQTRSMRNIYCYSITSDLFDKIPLILQMFNSIKICHNGIKDLINVLPIDDDTTDSNIQQIKPYMIVFQILRAFSIHNNYTKKHYYSYIDKIHNMIIQMNENNPTASLGDLFNDSIISSVTTLLSEYINTDDIYSKYSSIIDQNDNNIKVIIINLIKIDKLYHEININQIMNTYFDPNKPSQHKTFIKSVVSDVLKNYDLLNNSNSYEKMYKIVCDFIDKNLSAQTL